MNINDFKLDTIVSCYGFEGRVSMITDKSIFVSFDKEIVVPPSTTRERYCMFNEDNLHLLTIISEPKSQHDAVNSPQHYASDEIECIDVIMQNCKHLSGQEGALYANIQKYIWRYNKKNGVEDLRKAKWYLERLINLLENKNETI